jgi:hypothetical protein
VPFGLVACAGWPEATGVVTGRPVSVS